MRNLSWTLKFKLSCLWEEIKKKTRKVKIKKITMADTSEEKRHRKKIKWPFKQELKIAYTSEISGISALGLTSQLRIVTHSRYWLIHNVMSIDDCLLGFTSHYHTLSRASSRIITYYVVCWTLVSLVLHFSLWQE